MEGNDAAVVARVLTGDVEAYRVLVSRHRDRCLRYAYRMLGDQDEAEDVTQEALVRAYRSLARCDAPERFGAWLFTILANRVRTTTAKRTRHARVFMAEASVHEADVAAVPDSLSERSGLSVGEIERAIDRLPERQREAFLLKYVEEMSYEEMAVITGASVSALKMRVSRACDVLRSELAEAYDAR